MCVLCALLFHDNETIFPTEPLPFYPQKNMRKICSLVFLHLHRLLRFFLLFLSLSFSSMFGEIKREEHFLWLTIVSKIEHENANIAFRICMICIRKRMRRHQSMIIGYQVFNSLKIEYMRKIYFPTTTIAQVFTRASLFPSLTPS